MHSRKNLLAACVLGVAVVSLTGARKSAPAEPPPDAVPAAIADRPLVVRAWEAAPPGPGQTQVALTCFAYSSSIVESCEAKWGADVTFNCDREKFAIAPERCKAEFVALMGMQGWRPFKHYSPTVPLAAVEFWIREGVSKAAE